MVWAHHTASPTPCPPPQLVPARPLPKPDRLLAGSYSIAINALGWPAGTVPWTTVRAGEASDRPATRDIVQSLARRVEQGSAGLPVGVQVIDGPWRDHEALAVMGVLEGMRAAASA
jgi:fatty acid amide hydrolase